MITIVYDDIEAGDRSSERQNSLIDANARTIRFSEEGESNTALLPPLIDESVSVSSTGFMTVPSTSPSTKVRRSKKKGKKRRSKSRKKPAGPTSPSDYISATESAFDNASQHDDEETASVPEEDKKEPQDQGAIPVVNEPKPSSASSRENVLRGLCDDFVVDYGPRKTQSQLSITRHSLFLTHSMPVPYESPGEEGILRVDYRENKTELDEPDFWKVEHESSGSSNSLEKLKEELDPPSSDRESCWSSWCFCFGRRRRKHAKYVESYTSMELLKPAENVKAKSNNLSQQKNRSSTNSRSKHTGFSQSETEISGRDTETSVEFMERLNSVRLLPRITNLLVLDMDETLLHSSGSKLDKYDMLVMAGDNLENEVYVKKRPYVDDFLRACSKFALIFVFTASNQNYADPVLNALDKHLVVKKRFYKPDCIRYDGRRYDKPLSKVGHPIENTILVDNSPDSWRTNPHNAVRVSSWFDNPYDTQLLELIPILETFFLHYNDIRHVLDGNRRSFKWLKDRAKMLNPAITAKYSHLEKFNVNP